MSEEKYRLEHPYTEFEQTQVWDVINRIIFDLEENRDIELTTPREYIAGYICNQLKHYQLISEKALLKQ
jgi:hypothetical protein